MLTRVATWQDGGTEMKFRAQVEPPGAHARAGSSARGGGGARWRQAAAGDHHDQQAFLRSTVAIMRGRFLLGLSKANRQAACVAAGDEVEVEVEVDDEPRVVVEPADFARALESDPVALPPTTGWPTPTSASTCAQSKARRSLRRADGGSPRRWQCCASRKRQAAARPAPRLGQRGRLDPTPRLASVSRSKRV
jgi:hypothetical protein